MFIFLKLVKTVRISKNKVAKLRKTRTNSENAVTQPLWEWKVEN
jgi:hypothetical protein